MKLYPEASLWSEIAYLAYHLHWPLDDLLDLEHMDRVRAFGHMASIGVHLHDHSSGRVGVHPGTVQRWASRQLHGHTCR